MAGLRATNEIFQKNEIIEEKKETPVDNEPEGKEPEKARKKTQNVLSRSDSTGSGRKFLAPTLSDPQARANKDRFTDSKKTKSIKQKSQHLPNLSEVTHHAMHSLHHPGIHHGHHSEQSHNATSHNINLAFEVHDWWSEQIIIQESSDEES
jgi:sodium leak channel non-selective protein